MTRGGQALRDQKFDRHLFQVCGIAGLIGCVAAIAADILGILVYEPHDPVSESISALAVGPYGWIQDFGLYLLAAGAFACAVGLLRWNLNGPAWVLGCILLMVLGSDLVIVAIVNQYAGSYNVGANIHQWCFYAFGVLAAAVPLLLVPGLTRSSRPRGQSSLAFGLCWVVLAPAYFLVPPSWNGAYERFLAASAIAWLAAISWLLLGRSRDRQFGT